MMLCKQRSSGKGEGICIYVKTCYDATIIEQKFNCLSDTFEHFEIELIASLLLQSTNLRIHQLLILVMNFNVMPHCLVIVNLQSWFVMILM